MSRRLSGHGVTLFKIGDKATVKAPATSANLGCGFDTFGIALDLWLTLTVTACQEFKFTFTGDIDSVDGLPTDSSNTIVIAFMMGLRHLKSLPPPGIDFQFVCNNSIPVGRGLGSSAAAITAGLGAAFALCGKSLEDKHILNDIANLAILKEGHPDNVLPAIFGNMQIGVMKSHNDDRLYLGETVAKSDVIMKTLNFPSDDLDCVLFIPKVKFSTTEARLLLPEKHPRADVTQNIGRAAMFIAALLTRDYDNLKYAVEDRLHEPFRAPACPCFGLIKDVIPVTDALAACLSGKYY